MSYKITIEENTKVRREVSGDYCVISKDDVGDDEFGYAPRREQIVDTDIKVFEQIVEELDVMAVIMAVNGKKGE